MGFHFVYQRESCNVRNLISFVMVALSVMLLGIGSQIFRGQTVLLLLFILAAGILFVGGILIHKRGVKR
jgi:hypothetical protein